MDKDSNLCDYKYFLSRQTNCHTFDIVIKAIFAVFSLIGILGNALVILGVAFHKKMRSTINILIFSLALADILFILILVPTTTTPFFGSTLGRISLGEFGCKIRLFVISVTTFVSVYTLTCMSVFRYLAVVYPIKSLLWRSRTKACISSLLIWLVCLCANIPLLLQAKNDVVINNVNQNDIIPNDFVQNEAVQRHSTNWSGISETAGPACAAEGFENTSHVFYLCANVFGFYLPVAIMVFLYGKMLKHVRVGPLIMRHSIVPHEARNRKMNLMVVSAVAVFICCWLPLQVIYTLLLVNAVHQSTVFRLVKASSCVAFINSIVNPIIYAFIAKDFRSSFRKVLSGKCH